MKQKQATVACCAVAQSTKIKAHICHEFQLPASCILQDAFKQWLPRAEASSNPWGALASNAAAGAAAGALSLALVYPFEFATVRLAADLGGGASDRQFGQGKLAVSKTFSRSLVNYVSLW